MIDVTLLRKVANNLEKEHQKVSDVDIGQLNVDIREATVQLLTWQNIPRVVAVHLVEVAYESGK